MSIVSVNTHYMYLKEMVGSNSSETNLTNTVYTYDMS